MQCLLPFRRLLTSPDGRIVEDQISWGEVSEQFRRCSLKKDVAEQFIVPFLLVSSNVFVEV